MLRKSPVLKKKLAHGIYQWQNLSGLSSWGKRHGGQLFDLICITG